MVSISSRTQKGQASIQDHDGWLRVRFPRELFGGKIKTLALGLPNTNQGWTEADRRLKAIQTDIDLGQFDYTLERYKKPHQKQNYIKAVTELYPDIKIKDLWTRYLDYKNRSLKESTLDYLNNTVTKLLDKCDINSPYKALELREWLLLNTTESMTKRVLIHFNAAFKWGIKHKILKAPNPYDGMPQELKHKWEKESTPNAFLPQEKLAIIEAFQSHKGNWNGRGYTGYSYSHYAPFVKFLFLTGCRPSEAVGLRWADISSDFHKITFDGGIYRSPSGKAMESKGGKNNKKRNFPCNAKLQELLISIKPDEIDSNSLVFPSPTGKPIHYNNFCQSVWKKLVDPIKSGTTPYCCRDTFITEQISKNVAPAVVAKWVDNSVLMIEKHYLDGKTLSSILPQ